MPQMDLPPTSGPPARLRAAPFSISMDHTRSDTDCQFLSIGWAQYDAHDISAKTLRYPEQLGGRGSQRSYRFIA